MDNKYKTQMMVLAFITGISLIWMIDFLLGAMKTTTSTEFQITAAAIFVLLLYKAIKK